MKALELEAQERREKAEFEARELETRLRKHILLGE